MSFMSDFKDFAVKGNMIDLAVGVIIGGAFGKIVDSLVKDIIMPPIGMLLGGVDFKQLFINLSNKPFETLEAAEKAGVPLIKYGAFINVMVDFTILALIIFIFISQVNKLKKQADPTTKECPHCLSTIPLKATRCAHCTSELK